MIEVKNLVKRYGNHAAVNDLSFTVETGKLSDFSDLTVQENQQQ